MLSLKIWIIAAVAGGAVALPDCRHTGVIPEDLSRPVWLGYRRFHSEYRPADIDLIALVSIFADTQLAFALATICGRHAGR